MDLSKFGKTKDGREFIEFLEAEIKRIELEAYPRDGSNEVIAREALLKEDKKKVYRKLLKMFRDTDVKDSSLKNREYE